MAQSRLCPLIYKKWKEKGVTHLQHLFTNNTFKSFQELTEIFDLEENKYLKYYQLKSILM